MTQYKLAPSTDPAEIPSSDSLTAFDDELTMGASGEFLTGPDPQTGATRKKGLSFGMTSFFLVAQMAGAGFLALPRAISNTGWVGMFLLILFCVSVGFSATRLGKSWVILEERYLEYRKPARQPYQEIAYRALGVFGRRLALICVLVTLIGSTIVFINLIASMMNEVLPSLSICQWVLITAAFILPTTWLGTPKDFWQASVLAVVATAVAVFVIFSKLLIEAPNVEKPYFDPPTIPSFSLGFGALLFAFGGSSVFPTIQNDMNNRNDFWKSVVLSFTIILIMYVPVAATGYAVLGSAVKSNIMLSLTVDAILTIAIALQIVNLLGTFIISFNPVAQAFEDITGIPDKFCWQRILLRSSVIFAEVLVCLAVPDFGLILNLIGGSSITLLSFVLPPIMYIKLVDMPPEDPLWPTREINLWERIYLWGIVIVGVLGGIASTISAFSGLMSPESFQNSCFIHFDLGVNATLFDHVMEPHHHTINTLIATNDSIAANLTQIVADTLS